MAAGQLKRRLKGANLVSCNLLEQHGGKKKKNRRLSQNVVNMRPHISLEWDEVQKKAVARREQVGITWRNVTPFLDSVQHSHTGLADVITVPQEIFGLDNVNGVLSYEVWQTCLSESERKLLLQFLPRGIDADQAVKSLLREENLHFGNPLLKWGSSLCSGNLHPDAVLHKELCFKSNKKAYYLELQKYHNDILENLQRWKKKWTSCKDPEKDIVQKIWRSSRKQRETSFSSHAKESGQIHPEENLIASADSCSSGGDEKAISSKKDNFFDQSCEEYKKRKASTKRRCGNSLVASTTAEVDTNKRKKLIPRKLSISHGDPVTYMSCIKISRRQHQMVQNIKQCSDGIQFKSLNLVLGITKKLNMQTYGAFREEERMKLHEHWLQIACRDLPAAFKDHRERLLRIKRLMKSLEDELVEKKKPIIDEGGEKANLASSPFASGNRGEPEILPTISPDNHEHNDSLPQSTHHQPLLRIPSLNSNHEPGSTSPDCRPDREIVEQSCTVPIFSRLLDVGSTKEILEEETRASSPRDVWPAQPKTFYHPTGAGPTYMSASELSLRQPEQVKERPPPMIDLETEILEQPGGDDGPLFCSYSNQEQNQLGMPFLKGQQILQSYSREQINGLKQQELPFLMMNRGQLASSQFSRHFHEQRLLEQNRAREKELYANQNVQNIYNNGKYSNQEVFLPADLPDWAAGDSVRLQPFQTSSSGELLGHHWFSGENRGRTAWSGHDVSGNPGQYFGDGSNTDGSLYSVLPQWNRLVPRSLFDTTVSEKYFPARGVAGGSIPGGSEVQCRPEGMQFVYSNHQPNYMSQREAVAAALKANNAAWVNAPLATCANPEGGHHQISGLRDPATKPFLRSWNQ